MKYFFTLLICLLCTKSLLALERIFIHKTSVDNIQDFKTILDHPDLNYNPDAIIFVSHCWSCLNANQANLNTNGVYFSEDLQRWLIYNADQSPMPTDVSFFVYLSSGNYGTVRTCDSNANFFNIIDDPWIDNSENKITAAIHVSSGELFPHRIGVTYDYINNRHQVYTENQQNFQAHQTRIMFMTDGPEDVTAFRHYTNSGNTPNDITFIDHPLLNNKPNARFVFTHYKLNYESPHYQYYNKALTAFYSPFQNKWGIATEDFSQMPHDLIFNVFVDEKDYMNTEEIIAENKISISPNPATQFVRIDSKEPTQKISFINIAGQIVKEVDVNDKLSNKISISDLPKGTYIVRVQTNRNLYTEKLLVN